MKRYLKSITLALIFSGSVVAADDTTSLGWSGKQFKISPNDTVYVKITNHEELSGPFQVMANGSVSVRGVGVFEAAGENAGHLSRSIAAALPTSMANPEVKVWIVYSNKIYVLGQVRKPGEYTLTPSMAVTDAIKQAGGLTEWASQESNLRISIRRGSAYWSNYNEIVLQSGDVVVVP